MKLYIMNSVLVKCHVNGKVFFFQKKKKERKKMKFLPGHCRSMRRHVCVGLLVLVDEGGCPGLFSFLSLHLKYNCHFTVDNKRTIT